MKYRFDSFCTKIDENGTYGNALIIHLIEKLESDFQYNIENYIGTLIDEPNGLETLKIIRKECKSYAEKFRKELCIGNLSVSNVTNKSFFTKNVNNLKSLFRFGNFNIKIKRNNDKEVGEFLGLNASKKELIVNIQVRIIKKQDPEIYYLHLYLLNAYLIAFFDKVIDLIKGHTNITGKQIAILIYTIGELDYFHREWNKTQANREELFDIRNLNKNIEFLKNNNLLSKIEEPLKEILDFDNLSLCITSNELIEISRLSLIQLNNLNNVAFDYYKRNYDFQSVSFKDKYKTIPIKKYSSEFIIRIEQEEGTLFSYESYIQGFLSVYSDSFPTPYIDTPKTRKEFILKYIAPNPWLPSTPFNEKNAYDHGKATAYQFMAWKIVLENFTIFEDVFNDNSMQKESRKEPELNETKLSEKIKKHLGFLLGNCPRKGKPILNSEHDFNKLIEWTTYFYENNFELPEIAEPIKSVNTNNYFTQLAFMYLFDELRESGFHTQRTRAKTLFNLWESSFVNYKGYSEKNFWRVKHENSREVKKLMQIE